VADRRVDGVADRRADGTPSEAAPAPFGPQRTSIAKVTDPRRPESEDAVVIDYIHPIGTRVATVFAVLVLGGCASTSDHPARTVADHATTTSERPTTAPSGHRAHPQVVEPQAGVAGGSGAPRADPPPRTKTSPSTTPTPPSTTPTVGAPATAGGGVASGAPSDREVRAEIARFQLVVARYHLNRLDFSAVLLDPSQLPPGQYNVSIASVETLYGHRDACGGILRPRALGVANKTLPCGTKVIFRYGGRAIRVPVVDRGPYIKGREWDLSGAAAEALHFPGLGPVQWRLG
jgi:hypothetical protein